MVAKEAAKVASREEVKKAKKSKETKKANKANKSQESTEQNKKIRIRIRLLPIWLRVLLVLIFMVVSILVGLIVGYSVIGSGEASDALDQSTWQHIIDLVEKK